MIQQTSRYPGHRFLSEIVSHAAWLYHRFCLGFRKVEELLAERGITVTYETIRQWCQKFGPVDQDGDVLDVLPQHHRNRQAAERFFRRLIKDQGSEPRWLITDQLRSYAAAHRTVMPIVHHENQV